MTVNEYMNNPYGKSDKYPTLEAHKTALATDYEKIKDRIEATFYEVGTDLIVRFLIPSAGQTRIKYDVVLEFNGIWNTTIMSSLENEEFQAFSNCPSFIYTYANLFKTMKMTCDWLYTKYSKAVQNLPPAKRNPYVKLQFERSLYMAFYYMKRNGFMDPRNIKPRMIRGSKLSIRSKVRSQEEIEHEYKAYKMEEKAIIKAKESPVRSNRRATASPISGQSRRSKSSPQSTRSKKSPHVKSSKKTP